MPSLKTTKTLLYSTPAQVRSYNRLLQYSVKEAQDGILTQDVLDEDIEFHIAQADGLIKAYLNALYSESQLLSTPYVVGIVYPVRPKARVRLLTPTLGTGAITEQWHVVFKNTAGGANAEFNVSGSFSGDQGDGNVVTTFTSANNDLVIPASHWYAATTDSEWNEGESAIVAVSNAHRIVNTISAMLAAGNLISSLYGAAENAESGFARSLISKAMKILEGLAKREDGLSLLPGGGADPGRFNAHVWQIDGTGRDVSPYETIAGDILPLQTGQDLNSSDLV